GRLRPAAIHAADRAGQHGGAAGGAFAAAGAGSRNIRQLEFTRRGGGSRVAAAGAAPTTRRRPNQRRHLKHFSTARIGAFELFTSRIVRNLDRFLAIRARKNLRHSWSPGGVFPSSRDPSVRAGGLPM